MALFAAAVKRKFPAALNPATDDYREMSQLTDRQKTELARQKVQAMTVFYVHAAVFTLVMLILFVVDAAIGQSWWVQWPLLGWGAGLAAHWALVFGSGLSFLTKWQERKIEELKNKM